MSQYRKESFALLDEMGSPVRFMWHNGAELDHYGYDEFGCDLHGNVGKNQPFGYTGYCYDEGSGGYFAEARAYLPEMGRFAGEDILGGYMVAPASLNRYNYCLNSPLDFVDFTGEYPEWLETLLEGTDAHKTLSGHVDSIEGMNSSVYIPKGLDKESSPTYWTKSGKGFADFVYFNEDGEVEVYELKKDSKFGRAAGPIQLEAYIKAMNLLGAYDGKKVVKGYSQTDTFNCVLTSLKDEDKTFTYHTEQEKYKGMIFWTSVKKKKKKDDKENPAEGILGKLNEKNQSEEKPEQEQEEEVEEGDIAAATPLEPEPGVIIYWENDGFWSRIGDGMEGTWWAWVALWAALDDIGGNLENDSMIPAYLQQALQQWGNCFSAQ